MTCRVVISPIIERLLKQAYNPPLLDLEYSRIDFVLEYEDFCKAVRGAFQARGFEEKSYLVEEEAPSPPSRLVSVNILSEQAWCPRLIPAIAEVISDWTPEYAVWLLHDLLSLPPCDVFIQRETIFGSGNIDVLAEAGFVPS